MKNCTVSIERLECAILYVVTLLLRHHIVCAVVVILEKAEMINNRNFLIQDNILK